VAVLFESGHDDLGRHVSGSALAINSRNERVEMSLSEIYERARAKGLGEHIDTHEWQPPT
jgi:hypothetical protein